MRRSWIVEARLLGFVGVACAVLAGSPAAGEDLGSPGAFVPGSRSYGIGLGFGAHYATVGFKMFGGTQRFQGELSIGTEPFGWRATFGAGGSVLLLDAQSRVRPKLTVLWRSNASAVVVREPEREGESQDALDYDAFSGVAVLGGVLVRLAATHPAALEVAAGARFPFEGIDGVQRRADEFAVQYAGTGAEVVIPRWDYFTLSVGLHWPLP